MGTVYPYERTLWEDCADSNSESSMFARLGIKPAANGTANSTITFKGVQAVVSTHLLEHGDSCGIIWLWGREKLEKQRAVELAATCSQAGNAAATTKLQ